MPRVPVPAPAPLTDDERQALQAYALRVGDFAACERLEISYSLFARALAGKPVRRMSRTHIVLMLHREAGR